jgi:hypothetical protein|tara:strand:- start:415 stop:624 length:210 start_codon:yes stop_codon:yes gene_type:complete
MKRHSTKLAIFLCILIVILAFGLASPREGFTPRFIREKKNYTLRMARQLYQPYYRKFNQVVGRLKRMIL